MEPDGAKPDPTALAHPDASLREHPGRPGVPGAHRGQAHPRQNGRLQAVQDLPGRKGQVTYNFREFMLPRIEPIAALYKKITTRDLVFEFRQEQAFYQIKK